MTFFAVCLSIVLCEAATCKCIHAKCTHEVLWVPFLIKSIDTSSSNWLSTTSTKRTSLLVIMNFTVWFACKFEEASSSERLLTISAAEVFRMPLLSKCIYAVSTNRFVATSTLWSIKSVEVSLTVRSSIALKEVASAKWLQALSADEVIDVPLLAESSNAAIHNWFVAVSAFWTVKLLKALLAVRRAVLLVEVSGSKRFSAVGAREVLWMITFAHCLNDLS
jgi:hypothetical protein